MTLLRPVACLVPLLAFAAAHAGERDQLNSCKAKIKSAEHSQQGAPGAGSPRDNAELARCRQMIREWTLRDSRMLVDEDGRPLR